MSIPGISPPPVLNVHTPTSSFTVMHSLKDESLTQLLDKITRKCRSDFHNQRVQSGWVKYLWNDTVWNLDDDSDYTIFGWRQNSPPSSDATKVEMATLHVHNPAGQLPVPPAYRNPSFYIFHAPRSVSPRPTSHKSTKASTQGKSSTHNPATVELSAAKHRKEFEKFHSENGVRTVMGSIGPVENVRMLLKSGYRHVYVSRKFALKHGLIPADAAPGYYGYGGLLTLGDWPITLTPAASFDAQREEGATSSHSASQIHPKPPKSVSVPVYLSEEPHFDVVLGRSFFERRQIRTSPIDPTEVVCMDTGEKIECELVVLKDGRGEIVIVT